MRIKFFEVEKKSLKPLCICIWAASDGG